MPELRDLDERIRELVAQAVADAPPPPEIDATSVPLVAPDHHGRRRWWVGGGAALLVAAAAIALLFLVGGTDETVNTIPVTQPTVAPTAAPTSAATAPDTAETAVTTTTPPTSTIFLPRPLTVGADLVLTAGPEGVVEHGPGGTRTVTDEPVVFALATGDGALIVQRQAGDGTGRGWSDEDTVPQLVSPDGSLSPLLGTAEWDGGVVLHDVEVVEGRRLLLFSLQVSMNSPEGDETLYLFDLATGERTSLGSVAGYESGTGRLQLTAPGLIVGEAQGMVDHSPLVMAVPGSVAAAEGPPTPEELGWQPTYSECFDCPRDFAVSANGTTLAWVDDTVPAIVTRSIDPAREAETFAAIPNTEPRYIDLRLAGGAVLISYHAPASAGGPPPPPVLVEADGTVTTLEGVVATSAPLS